MDCFTLYKERKKDKVVKTQKLSKGKGSKYQMVFSSQLVFQPFEKKKYENNSRPRIYVPSGWKLYAGDRKTLRRTFVS